MLKPISTDLSHLLSWFFSLCCQWSYVPSLWRHAQVYPIFKKGDPSLPSNYRPISLTSVFRKLLELSLAPWLASVSPRLDLAQGGFRPRRSALDQALWDNWHFRPRWINHDIYGSIGAITTFQIWKYILLSIAHRLVPFSFSNSDYLLQISALENRRF
ncbi:hypothetical protein G6F46_013767 [Rhizopus delemar]|nr:hypothetical protein G6F46_013767 [Rhizopus delemar]